MTVTQNSIEDQIAAAWPLDRPPKRVVIKIGSNALSTPEGLLDEARIAAVAEQATKLRQLGSLPVIISSGAVAAGMGLTGHNARPTQLPILQGLAAIGQGRLIGAWSEAFRAHDSLAAQMLLTRDDLEDRGRYLNAWYTLENLLEMGATPIINENDSVATHELTFGDNDMLSALIACKISAELLIILTDTDGLYSGNPKTDANAALIPVVKRVTEEIAGLAGASGSRVGRGGMASKVSAARHAARFGVTTVIARAENADLVSIAQGRFRGTLFPPSGARNRRGRARSHWIATHRPRGILDVDAGAHRALAEGGKSLLPIGVTAVEGKFSAGDVVGVRLKDKEPFALGLTNYSSEEIERLMGHHSQGRENYLPGAAPYAEIIHRDNLLITAEK